MAEDLTAFLRRLERHASARLVAPDVCRKRDETLGHLAASSLRRHVHASSENSPSDVAMERDGKRDSAVTFPVPSLTEVCAHLMGAERGQLAAEAAGGDRLAQLVVEATACRPEPVAWRLYSRRLDRALWVARDIKAATELDRDGARNGLPVVLAGDLERLRDFDDHRLTDLLDVLRHFPRAGIAELDPEAAS
jgi:hypothetical protein